jgi:hypothetical protein
VRTRIADAWALWAILAAQLALTLPWLWRTAPFTDEALYLQAGHQELAHWLHHAPVADYAGWFSGSPGIYPPLAAATDSLGGLVAARAISLAVMLAATALVYLIGERLLGHLAGVLGALLFAVCGLVVHYGAFATFGPLALFLLVLAAWLAVRSADGGIGWLAGCAVALLAANATKYATLAWDPAIAAILLLASWDKGKGLAIGRTASLAATVGALDLGLLMLGGADYNRGVVITTIFRSIHWGTANSAASVLLRALALTGVLVVPALIAVLVSLASREPVARTLLLCVLVLAALVAPLQQARIHQLPSLDKNMAFGLPFAALGAGYAMSKGRQWLSEHRAWGPVAATGGIVALVVAALVAGRMQKIQFRGPGIAVATKLVAAIKRDYLPRSYIVSDGAARMEQYYLPGISSERWIGSFTPGAAQRARITGRICSGEVSVVVLRLTGKTYDHAYDRTILALLWTSHRYRLATTADQGNYTTQVWMLDRRARARADRARDPAASAGSKVRGCQ